MSTSADDAAAGTGVRLVQVTVLDANYLEQVVLVATNGTTPVAMAGTWLRVNGLICLAAGSGGQNAGAIIVRVAGGGAVLAHAAIGVGRAQQCIYTVPATENAFAVFIAFGTQKPVGALAEFELQIRPFNGCWITGTSAGINSNSSLVPFIPPIPNRVPARTDIRGRVVSVSTPNTTVTVNVQAVLCTIPP